MLELLDKIDKRKLYLAIGGEKVQALEALIGSKLVAGEKKDTNLSAYTLQTASYHPTNMPQQLQAYRQQKHIP